MDDDREASYADLDMIFAMLISKARTPDEVKEYLQSTGRHSELHIKFYLDSYTKFVELQNNEKLIPRQRQALLAVYIANNSDFIEINRISREKKRQQFRN